MPMPTGNGENVCLWWFPFYRNGLSLQVLAFVNQNSSRSHSCFVRQTISGKPLTQLHIPSYRHTWCNVCLLTCAEVSTATKLQRSIVCRPVASIFRREVTQMSDLPKYARLGGGLGACSPRKLLEIRCSEIASVAILGQKQGRSSYMAHGVLHPIFGCPCMHLLSQLNLSFHERSY